MMTDNVDEVGNPLVRRNGAVPAGEELPTPAALRWEFIKSDLKKKSATFSSLRDYK